MNHSLPETQRSQAQGIFGPVSTTPWQSIALILLALLCAIAEFTIVRLYIDGTISGQHAGLLHLTVVVMLCAYVWLCRCTDRDLRYPIVLTATTLTTGPVGPIGTLFAFALTLSLLSSTTSFEEWYAKLFSDTDADDAVLLAEHIQQVQNTMTSDKIPTPFGDVLSFGNFAQKQKVIAMIIKNFRPAFAPSLQMALRDSNSAVRVQAATAMAKIERGFMTKTMELNSAHANAPRDSAVLLRLARHLDDYAFSGILDHGQEQENRTQALRLYRNYIDLQPDNLSVRLAVGRLLIRQQEHRAAVAWFEESLRQGHSSSQLLLWLIESQFHLGALSEVRRLVDAHKHELIGDVRVPDKVILALKMWTEKDGD